MKILLFLFLLMSPSAFSSTQLDSEYGYRTVAAVVTNSDKEPVYGEQVENEIVSFLRKSMRFEFSDSAFLYMKDKLKLPKFASGERQPSALIDPMKPLLKDLFEQGIQAVVLAEVIHTNDEYKVALHLTTTAKGEAVFSTTVPVENSESLDSFTAATRIALADMMKTIPFDSSIIRRDGYLVVLDRGAPAFHSGQQLSTFSIEKKGKDTIFEETGVIGLTRVEANLSFGKILVERRPAEVTVGNKIRLDNAPVVRISPSLWSAGNRGIASESSYSEFEVTKGKLGLVSANMGLGLTTYGNTNANGTESHVNMIYPGGSVAGEVWLTSRMTLGLSMKYAFSSSKSIGGATKEAVGSTVNDFRFLWGYRINLLAPLPGPILHFKLGYGKQSFGFNSDQELLYTSVSYSGIMLGGGVTLPIAERYGLGFDINTIIFPGVTEEPVMSGDVMANVSAWDFVLRGYYSYDRRTDFEAKLFFQRNGSDFSGASSRTLGNISSASQVSKGLLFGVNYYF